MMLFLLITCLMALSCSTQDVQETKEVRLAQATNDLAFDLLRSSINKTNVFLSPFSISTALAMVYLGADGNTARAMRNVLKHDQYNLTPQEVNEGFQFLLTQARENTEDYILSTFNELLVDQHFTVLESFQNALRQQYFAQVENVDFAGQGEQVKAKINADVENATRGKITEFLDSPPSRDAKLFLLNAVYFLGNWRKPFNPEFTSDGTFYNLGVHEKTVKMMSRDGQYRYSKDNGLDADIVVLPYKGNDTAEMIVVIPKERTSVVDLQQSITQGGLAAALGTTRVARLLLSVPKFSLAYSADLKENLEGLGLQELFSNTANFNRIAGENTGLKVSSVVHKAVIDVNERGSEAAAATGVEFVPLSLPPQIIANKPFLFFIRENHSGMILFSGRVDEL